MKQGYAGALCCIVDKQNYAEDIDIMGGMGSGEKAASDGSDSPTSMIHDNEYENGSENMII